MGFRGARNLAPCEFAIAYMEKMVCVWVFILVLQMQCACGGGPLQDQKHWRRPVPGWRQSPESLALENQGFGFEEAEFEVHFSEKGENYFKIKFRPATHEPVSRKFEIV